MKFIDTIEIKNFKSIRHQKIDGCKRINVFIGYPNVGKSNILEAIGLYSSLLWNNQFFKFNDLCRVKHFSELFFNKDYREATNIIINSGPLLELIIDSSNDLTIRVHGQFDRIQENVTNVFSATINNQDFNYRISKYAGEVELRKVLMPIRKYEFKNDSVINQQRPFMLSVPFGMNLLDIIQRDSRLRKEIAIIFDEYNLKLFLDNEEIKFLKYLSDDTGVSIPYHLIADTLRRLIFYKAAIFTNKDSVLLFEEPEAHMFPPYITKFTSDIWFNKENQYFITTHSPFVLNDFLENARDELAIYILDYKKEKGETVVKRMTDEDVHEAYQYGMDIFLNVKSFIG